MSSAPSWKSYFTNVPRLTKALSTAMTAITFFGFALRLRDMAIVHRYKDAEEMPDISIDSEATLIHLLAMVPISSPYRFWTFATAALFERSIIQFALNTSILLGCGKYLERAWGSREFFKFVAITSVGTMVGVYITCLLEYLVRRNEDILFDTQAYGLTCVISGFLIGFKQLVPDHSITLWKVVSVRVKSLPLLFAMCMMIQGFIFRSQLQLLMAIYGLFTSWIYSRFFRVQDGIRGDRSESFSFASFFPGLLQTPVKHISNAFFGILVKLKICTPTGFGGSFQYDLENPQMSGMGHTFTQPGSLRAEAERRRQLALKALDMRLHAAMGNSGSGQAGSGRQMFFGASASTKATSVSLLSLSAEPLPDFDEDEVLFETDALDVNGSLGRSRTASTSDRKEAKDKE
ncbi:MAG: eukaryotic integral membrane protein-domain-containing protein [Podila humilis]|nr:MAG: eukaryotic integral membrane protein-domain-containing protein [Podila humilis]